MGWNAGLAAAFAAAAGPGQAPARVVRADYSAYVVAGAAGEWPAQVTGRFRHGAARLIDYPAVGDWVAVEVDPAGHRAAIHAVLPRRTCLLRKTAGDTSGEQVLAANVDTAFLVHSLDGGRNFNRRSLERYLALIRQSGAQPVIVLNKIDLCPAHADAVGTAGAAAPGVAVHPVSATAALGLAELDAYLRPGCTVALLGPSGVGKSALLNALLNEDRQDTTPPRASDLRGRHTTTVRQLFQVPAGAWVMDNPGLREMQLFTPEEALLEAFEEIAPWAAQCRFRDCLHEEEPGCAVRQAVETGTLAAARLAHYQELRRQSETLRERSRAGNRRERGNKRRDYRPGLEAE